MPSTMKQVLENQTLRDDFVKDCVLIIAQQVESQKDFSGIAMKNAYKLLEKLTPGATRQATELLVDDFAEQIEPYLQEFSKSHLEYQPLPDFLASKASNIAESFLQVTDSKAHTFDSTTILAFYKTLRPHAKKHVEKAVPDIALLLQKYLVTPAGIEPASAT